MTDTLHDLEAASSTGERPALGTPDVGAKVAENSGFLSVAAGVVGVVSYACSLLMANMLGTADYTQFAAAAMLLGVVGIVASALVPLPLSHFVAVHPAGSDGRRDGMAFSVFLSCIAGIAAAATTGALTLAFSTPPLAAAVATGALAIFLMAAPSGWLQGELRFTWYAMTTIGEVLLRLGFSVLVILLAWGAVGAILGFAVGALALVAVPWSFYRDLQWRPGVLRQRWRWAETSDIASVLCVVSVLVGVDVVVVAFLDEGPAAAGFQALATIAKGPVYVAAGTALVAFPLLRRPGVNVREVLGAAFASFSQLAVVAFAIIATAPHLLAGVIIPEKYHGSLELLPWLAAAGLGYAVLTVLTTILLALRAYRRCQLGLACACLLVVAGLWTGWQLDAVSGLAVGSAIGAVVAAAVLILISWPVLAAVGPAKGAYRFSAGTSVLLLLLAVAAQLQPVAWLVLAAISGIAVLAHQRGLLPRTLGWGTARRRFGAPVRSAGRRSKAADPSSNRLAISMVRVVSSPVSAFIAVSAAAFGVRAIGLARGFELWVDELLYVRLGESLTTGQVPTLPDGPFFLHPPGFFLLEAGTIKLFGISGDIVEVVLQLRWLNAALGAITVGLGFLLVRKLAGTTAAWLAAVVLAFEPFILRNNSHAFLETSAMAFVLAGFLVLTGTRTPNRRLPAALRLIAVGLLLGYAVLCKDFFIICTVGPVAVAVIWKRTLPWRQAAVVLIAAAVPYATYLAIAASQAHLPDWIEAKTSGILRASGLEKSTGFTAEGSPNIMTRLIEQSGHFGTSYLLLALCPVAGALLCFSRRADRRVIGLAGFALGAAGAYSAAFGTFEEQYGYGVMIAGVLCSVLVVVELRERFSERSRKGFRQGRTFLAIASLCFVALTVVLGARTAFTVDNGFVQVKDWVKNNLPQEARVSVSNSTGEFAFADDPRFGVWPSAPLMQGAGANYILTQSHPTSQGYGYAQPEMLTWLKEYATPVFSAEGPTNGSTTLWLVAPAELSMGAANGTGTPSKTYETER
ncbi:Membrane protein involved in the export of O-antigen and teichoic acid [Arthrobacter sp. yr096]|uniref:glycosyltransferase family 39 protein n=1 Tax=Arthrobacter sp. yr096 TaxID=1761750 RepID=UPI0008C6B87F|nr:glycosyltransferase family 39 protein [Arthrobacter sp. yr096]SEI71047.1 Membrane protein involved in the export of O-antigen and teichoic acid [Arthrobacter sp. yr096]